MPPRKKKRTDITEPQVFENDEELLNSLVVDLQSEFGEGTMLLEDSTGASVSTWVPTGSPVLDKALGGGWPGSRIVEVYGPESNGKTTVALHAIAETQKMGGIAVFLDSEHALSKERAKSLGVDLKKMVYTQPETMEATFRYIEKIVDLMSTKYPGKLITIVWDSIAATTTEKEMEGDYGETGYLDHPRIMSQGFRKITRKIAENNVLLICINQIRDKMGVSFGDSVSTFGRRS